MRDREKIIGFIYGAVSLVMCFIILLVLLALTSCGTPKNASNTETINTERSNDMTSLFDSIVSVRLQESLLRTSLEQLLAKKDCLVITIDTAGNEKKREEYHSTDKARNKETTSLRFDSTSILKAQIDSLRQLNVRDFASNETEIQYVKKELSCFQKTLIGLGLLMIVFIILKIVLFIYNKVKAYS